MSTAAPVGKKMFLTVAAAAELAGLSERHFKRQIEEGRIPHFKINGKFFVLGRDLDKWKADRKLTPEHF